MIVLDALDVLDDLAEDQRELLLSGLLDNLTQFSHYTILEAQLEWDGSKPYQEFVRFQNDIIKDCIRIEMSQFGVVLRRMHGLEPLSKRTEIYL